MTRATYNPTGNTLTELPDLDSPPDKPIENNYWGNRAAFYRDMINWQRVMDDYNANALKITAVCRTIPCSPECRDLFENGKTYEEGRDYEVREESATLIINGEARTVGFPSLVAFPLPVKSEQGEDDLWRGLILENFNDTEHDYSDEYIDMKIAELKSKYSLTKR